MYYLNGNVKVENNDIKAKVEKCEDIPQATGILSRFYLNKLHIDQLPLPKGTGFVQKSREIATMSGQFLWEVSYAMSVVSSGSSWLYMDTLSVVITRNTALAYGLWKLGYRILQVRIPSHNKLSKANGKHLNAESSCSRQASTSQGPERTSSKLLPHNPDLLLLQDYGCHFVKFSLMHQRAPLHSFTHLLTLYCNLRAPTSAACPRSPILRTE